MDRALVTEGGDLGVAGSVAAVGLDLDDLGSEIREDHAAERSCDDLAELENRCALQHSAHRRTRLIRRTVVTCPR